MAAGDIASAAGMATYNGGEEANELWIRDNEILDEVATDRVAVRSIARGGTGADNAPAALAALGALPAADVQVSTAGGTIAGTVPRYDASGRLAGGTPVADNQLAPKAYVDAAVNAGSWDGGTVGGQILVPNSYPASSSYTVCYINGDGRISRGASALRFKKYVSDVDPLKLGEIFPQLVRYQHKSAPDSRSDNAWHYGHIADRLADVAELQPFVVYETESDGFTLTRDSFGLPVPLSIDFIALLLAQTAQLHDRVKRLENLVAQLVDGKEGI